MLAMRDIKYILPLPSEHFLKVNEKTVLLGFPVTNSIMLTTHPIISTEIISVLGSHLDQQALEYVFMF